MLLETRVRDNTARVVSLSDWQYVPILISQKPMMNLAFFSEIIPVRKYHDLEM